MDNNKLSTEELEELREVNDLYTKLIRNLGESELLISDLEAQLNAVTEQKKGFFSDYRTIKEKSDSLYQTLSEKYGSGRIDLETGVIHPA